MKNSRWCVLFINILWTITNQQQINKLYNQDKPQPTFFLVRVQYDVFICYSTTIVSRIQYIYPRQNGWNLFPFQIKKKKTSCHHNTCDIKMLYGDWNVNWFFLLLFLLQECWQIFFSCSICLFLLKKNTYKISGNNLWKWMVMTYKTPTQERNEFLGSMIEHRNFTKKNTNAINFANWSSTHSMIFWKKKRALNFF